MSKRISVTVKDSQYELGLQKAKEQDMSLSEFVRRSMEKYINAVEMMQKKRQKQQNY